MFFSPPQSVVYWRFLPTTVTHRETKHMQLQDLHNKATKHRLYVYFMSDSASSLSGSVFCQVCLQFQAEVLIYLSLSSAGEARLDEWQIPFVAVRTYRSPCRWPFTANRCWRSELRHPLRAHCNTRWHCVSVAAGHLAGCLDRTVGCQQLQDPADQSTSDGLTKVFTQTQGCQSLSHKDYAKENHTEWKKTWQGKDGVVCSLTGLKDSLWVK